MFFPSESLWKRAGKLADRLALSYLFIAWPGFFVFMRSGWEIPAWTVLAVFAWSAMTIPLHAKGWTTTARICLALSMSVSITGFSLALGRGAGVHILLLAAILNILILFDWERERHFIVIGILVNSALFLGFQAHDFRIDILYVLNREVEWLLHPALSMASALILITGILQYVIRDARGKKDLIAARDSAQSALQEKNQLMATMGHDLRTPLNVIMGSAQLMEKPNSESENKEFLANIRTAAKDLLAILNDVLDLSKIEAGKAKLDSKPFQMLELVDKVLAAVLPQVEQKGLKLRLDAGTEAFGALRGDPCRLKHVLHILLSNALKSTGSGTLVLSVRHAGENHIRPRIRFVIADTESWNAMEGREGSDQDFRQANDSTARNLRGSKLDLFLCRGLVELMGGSLIVSSHQGSGAMVVCTIPFDAISGTESPSPEPDVREAKPLVNGIKALEAGTARILVVDDHPVNRMILQSMLQMHGFKADEVADGKQALDAIMVRPYDLILMDCHMPVMDGIECTRRIRAMEGPRPIIIGITADTLPETRNNCLQVGMDQVLLKPLQEQELRTVLCPWKAAEESKAPVLPTPVVTSIVSEWLDVERLNRLIQSTRLSDPGHRKKALEQFESDVQDLRQALGEALDLGRAQQLKESAHGLKGLCLTLGLSRLADICKRIEGISGVKDSPDWSPVKSDFDTVCEASLADLRRAMKV